MIGRIMLACAALALLVGCGVAPSACVEGVSSQVQTETARVTYENGHEVLTLTVGGAAVATRAQGWGDVLHGLGYELVPCGCWESVDGQHVAEVVPTD